MKKFCFDLDGIICSTKNNNYKMSKTKKNVIKVINKLSEKNYIMIYTSRFMGRNKDNVNLAKKMGYKFTLNQLNKWGLKFDKLLLGKPSYDIFIDDKSFNFQKNWLVDFKKKFIKNS